MATVTAAALAGTTAPAAADDCPNAAVRAQQGVQHLPNCMAYERVTPAEKGGAVPVMEDDSHLMPSGDGLVYQLRAAIEGAPSLSNGRFRVMRGAGGWETVSLNQPMVFGRQPLVGDAFNSPQRVTPDLSRMLFRAEYPFHPNDFASTAVTGTGGSVDGYRWDESNRTFQWVVPDTSVVQTTSIDSSPWGMSADGERILLLTTRPYDPAVTTSVGQLYLWTEQATRVVSVMPGGGPAGTAPTVKASTSAADLRRIAFMVGSGANRRIYVRFDADDPAKAATREITGPNGETCLSGDALQMSPDGRKLLFSCTRGASDPSTALATGSYVKNLDGPAGTPLEQAIPGIVGMPGGTAAGIVSATADLSVVYTQDQSSNTTVWQNGVAERTFARGTAGTGNNRGQMSVDGEFFTFVSTSTLGVTNENRAVNGSAQVYLFSVRTGETVCVSCRRDGVRTDGAALLTRDPATLGDVGTNPITPVSDRGTVVFNSLSALVPEDTNGKLDAYVWIDGRAVLLGRAGGDAAWATGSTPDGSSLFFVSGESLVADDTDGGAPDLYVARSAGGVLLPEPEASCETNCRNATPGHPGSPSVGSTAEGAGNVAERAVTVGRASVALSASSSVKGTSSSVRVRVSRPGTIRVSGNGLRRATKTVKKAGTYRVRVRLSPHGRKQQRKRGRMTTRMTARLTPDSGAPVQARKSVAFAATKKGGR